MECELLSIIEALKEFKNVSIGQILSIYTDDKNMVHKATLYRGS